jgi:3-dehydroquinate synthase
VSKNFTVKSSIHDYDVNFVEDFTDVLSKVLSTGDVMLIDSNVYDLYNERLKSILQKTNYVLLTPTEDMKSYLNVSQVIENVIEMGLKKNNKLVVLGGGISQDIGTFMAMNLYRGIGWYFFPTTLLAMADSCIGGKASINFGRYKNLLGNFYPPTRIFIDTAFIDTLPRREIISGLGEMTHFFFVSGEDDYKLIRDNYQKSLTDKCVLERLIHRSLRIKKATIEIDEFDHKERQIFNYGHSFGHAIESVSNYRVPHGVAVSHGMDIANFLSVKLGLINEELRLRLRKVLQFSWNEVFLDEINVEAFIGALRKDKKNLGDEVRVILTRGLGDMFITRLDVDGEAGQWIREYFTKQSHKG